MYKDFAFSLFDNLWKSSTNMLKEDPKISLMIKAYCLSQLHSNQSKLSKLEKQIYLNMLYEMKNLKVQYQSYNAETTLKDYENYLKKRLTFLEYQNMKGNQSLELSEMYLSLSKQYEPLKSFNGFNENYMKLQCYCHSIAEDIANKNNKSVYNDIGVIMRNSAPQTKKDIKGEISPFVFNNKYSHDNALPSASHNRTISQVDPLKDRILRRNSDHVNKANKQNEADNSRVLNDNFASTERSPFPLSKKLVRKGSSSLLIVTPSGEGLNYVSSPKIDNDESLTGSLTFMKSLNESSTSSFSTIPSFASPTTKKKLETLAVNDSLLSPANKEQKLAIKTSNINAIKHLEDGYLALSIQLIKNSINALKDLDKGRKRK